MGEYCDKEGKVRPVCATCGSAAITLETMGCHWDHEKQTIVVTDVCDGSVHYCDQCDGASSIVWRTDEEIEIRFLKSAISELACIFAEKRSDVTDMCDGILAGKMPKPEDTEHRFVTFSIDGKNYEYDSFTTHVLRLNKDNTATVISTDYVDSSVGEKITPICGACGSANIEMGVEACFWNDKMQKIVAAEAYPSDDKCWNCSAKGQTVWKKIEEK
jgi:hypothetical protein